MIKISKEKRNWLLWAIITVISFIVILFNFRYALLRIFESLVDLVCSIIYYFDKLFNLNIGISVTVNDYSLAPYVMPFNLPNTWEEFVALWEQYWTLIFSLNNLSEYGIYLSNLLFNISQILLLTLPLFLCLFLLYKLVYLRDFNNDYNEESESLKTYKHICKNYLSKVKTVISEFISFIKSRKLTWIVWLIMWGYAFNLITVCIEVLAYYFYFVVEFDFLNLFKQFFKLLLDLSPAIEFLPTWLIITITVYFLHKFRKKVGYKVLNHNERKNCGFINERPIVTLVCGTMGKKKTTKITDMALSQAVMFKEKAFELMLENDLKFPNFPWVNFENELKFAIKNHDIYNLATARLYVSRCKATYDLVKTNDIAKARFIKHCKKHPYRYGNLMFDYDYERYGLTHYDGLKTVTIWEVLTSYAQLYFVYVIESSLILGNYSVRTDNVISDIGNLPLWDNDFFKRGEESVDYSHHSHILDFDTLRLGKHVVENNKNVDSFEFGVVLVTEIGKERKNALELRELKKVELTANQKNDGFNDWLKMVRHSATIDNFPFVKVIADEQRPESWGADARDLCEIVNILESSETRLAMPFFALEELLYDFIFSRFINDYIEYRYYRADNTLPMYVLKSTVSLLHKYYKSIYNRFGYTTLTVEIEKGTQTGEKIEKNYYLSHKKIYSNRFSTDCYSDFFNEKALRSNVGILDIPEYESEKASYEELELQNSYFMRDLMNIKGD